MSALSYSLQIPALLGPFPSRKCHNKIQIPLPKLLQHQLPSQLSFIPQRTFQCFSQKHSTQQEFEVERLFSNVNQATLKREPGIIFFNIITLFSVYLVSYLLLLVIINIRFRKFIQCHFSCCRYNGMSFFSVYVCGWHLIKILLGLFSELQFC